MNRLYVLVHITPYEESAVYAYIDNEYYEPDAVLQHMIAVNDIKFEYTEDFIELFMADMGESGHGQLTLIREPLQID
jgi:hypothetical protein